MTASTSEPKPDVDIVTDWYGPQKCHWRGCTSKATFHSPSALKAHIKNVHISPLVCTHPGCPYKKPFGKQCDLKRHLATIHSTEREYQCLESECQETFSRKDKMLKHAREKHELFRCSFNHCTAMVFAAEREPHLQESHGPFECGMGSCQVGGRSYFRKDNLQRHLRTVHRVAYDPVEAMMFRLHEISKGAEKAEVLQVLAPLLPTYRDCEPCLAKKQDEQQSRLGNTVTDVSSHEALAGFAARGCS